MNLRKAFLTLMLALAATCTSHAGPISKGGFVITKPGKYFLTKNIAVLPVAGLATPVGVVIKAQDVELDLAGFTIGPAANQPGVGTGIWLDPEVSRIRVQNGRVQNVATGVGGIAFAFVDECIIERLQIECQSVLHSS